MTTTNAELKQILEAQGEERRERDMEVTGRLSAIEEHLKTLNGSVARNSRDIESLPCTEHDKTLVRLATQVDAQPTAREMGRLEERQEVHKSNWQKAWEFVRYPALLVLGALAALVLSGNVP